MQREAEMVAALERVLVASRMVDAEQLRIGGEAEEAAVGFAFCASDFSFAHAGFLFARVATCALVNLAGVGCVGR